MVFVGKAFSWGMMLVDTSTVISVVLARLKKCGLGETVELLTWKRDRSLCIRKEGKDVFLVVEKGFVCDAWRGEGRQLARHLKRTLKREFPRSHKVRMHVIGA